jgi:hypothetical protein
VEDGIKYLAAVLPSLLHFLLQFTEVVLKQKNAEKGKEERKKLKEKEGRKQRNPAVAEKNALSTWLDL